MTETAHFQMPCEEEMIKTLSEEYDEKYVKRYINHKDEPADKDSLSGIIRHLRRLHISTFDFRAAKEYYRVYELKRLEARYVALVLRKQAEENYKKTRKEAQEAWKKSMLDEYGTWQNYFEACGYEKHGNSYYKPNVKREKSLPDVLGTFHEVSNKNAKRIGYRGKVNEEHEKVIKNAKV